MRVALEVPAVLEGAGFAFVDIQRHQARRRLRGDDAPLAARREARAAEPAQARVFHDLGDLFARALAGMAVRGELVTAFGLVGIEVDVRRLGARGLLLGDGLLHRVDGRIRNRVLADDDARGDFAAADARGGNHAHVLSQRCGQVPLQRRGAGQFARDRVADPHGERRRGILPLFHHFEVVVERRHLIDLGVGEAHLFRQRGEVRGGQVPVAVVDEMQILDEEIGTARLHAAPAASLLQEGLDLAQRPGIDLPALWSGPGFSFDFHGRRIIGPSAARDS